MRSPKKGKRPSKVEDDHRPNMTIVCMLCSDKKPSEGSKNFLTFKVCASCVSYLKSVEEIVDKQDFT